MLDADSNGCCLAAVHHIAFAEDNGYRSHDSDLLTAGGTEFISLGSFSLLTVSVCFLVAYQPWSSQRGLYHSHRPTNSGFSTSTSLLITKLYFVSSICQQEWIEV
ncbi:hypothetical protein ONS95_013722 [Cadophora gregata]|uniref:uncharacterized protein n=1 Tax=Cadophora gregata TaxID=51156 RepID=UPI0026DC7374|nr:uncharacterized protein ONS95_013722 [Cadophora gregata]KAK0113465.1 hypothetical protein ONS96_014330 [Cadophora gregata f. sp. sojae]KAK0114223.1 hypothetical protein ONS95_013722 [Cadophora gregata]